MEIIGFKKWKPSAEDPGRQEYAGQRTAQEVFEELKHRLESMGYLPDEYFLLDSHWENGKEIPKDASIFCTADYGGSEGVYLDAYLQWPEHNQLITRKFITGKTLGENGNDLDRMFLISSAITKAFHGDHATHARYMKIGGVEDDTGGAVLHLSQQEQRTIINALVEQRERQEEAMSQTEQLLRRMTGSITAYINETGMRPLRMSDYDKAVLAVRDGEMAAFTTFVTSLDDKVDVIYGVAYDESLGDRVKVTILAAGFDMEALTTTKESVSEPGIGMNIEPVDADPDPAANIEQIKNQYGSDKVNGVIAQQARNLYVVLSREQLDDDLVIERLEKYPAFNRTKEIKRSITASADTASASHPSSVAVKPAPLKPAAGASPSVIDIGLD